MEGVTRHDRTARLLEARLECLAGVAERSLAGARALDRRVLALEAATRNAIALGLLSPAEAAAIWATVARRHPDVRWCRDGPRPAAESRACVAVGAADARRDRQAS